jgi:site-specific DNA recombinase
MIGGYVRVSSLQQKDNYSVETQRDRVIAFAKQQGEQYELYDEAKSGKNLERPEFLRLLKDVESKKITKVWVIEASRLTRDVEDAQTIKRILKKYKVELYVNDQHVDLATSESILSYNITSAVSEYERSKIIDRVVRSRRKQIDDGEQAYCSLLGYDYVFGPDGKKVWSVNEKEAETVRNIFAWYDQGLSYRKIANRLSDSGVRSKKGGRFTPGLIRIVLCRPEYYGMVMDTKGKLVKSKIYTPIVESNVAEVLERQKEKRGRVAKQFREAKSEAAGLARCRKCGAPYYINRNTVFLRKTQQEHTYVRYAHLGGTTKHAACHNSPKYIDSELLESFLAFCYQASLRNRFEIQSLIEAKEKEIFLAEQQLVDRLAELKAKLDLIEANRKKLIEGVASGLYTNDDISDSIKRQNEEKAAIKSTHDALKAQLDIKRADVEAITHSFADKNIELFESATPEGRRDIYVNVIRSLLVEDGWIYLEFITGRKVECPIKQIPAYMKAIEAVGTKEAFAGNRHRWDELKSEE